MPRTKRRRLWQQSYRPLDMLAASWANYHNTGIDALGDSVTVGSGASDNAHTWWALLMPLLAVYPDAVGSALLANDGHAGQSTAGFISNAYATTVIGRNPALVLFQSPVKNDYGQNLTLATTKANLISITNTLRAGLPKARIILWTPNPNSPDTTNTQSLLLADYVQATRDVCSANGFELMDVYGSFVAQAAVNSVTVASLLSDGIHPNDTGQTYIRDAMLHYLARR